MIKPNVLELPEGTHYLCMCGQSGNKPYCDGSHVGTGIEPELCELAEKTTLAFCQCGNTGIKPLCDGSHAKE